MAHTNTILLSLQQEKPGQHSRLTVAYIPPFMNGVLLTHMAHTNTLVFLSL